jgi:hypothetical protein
VAYKVVFGTQRDVTPPKAAKPQTRRTATAPVPAAPAVPKVATAPTAVPTSRIARQLALAYYLRDAVEAGRIKDYREAGRRLGLCFPQVTHVMSLLHLSARLQERLLLGELVLSESAMRPTCRLADWAAQENALHA